jgi:hypothetical protein
MRRRSMRRKRKRKKKRIQVFLSLVRLVAVLHLSVSLPRAFGRGRRRQLFEGCKGKRKERKKKEKRLVKRQEGRASHIIDLLRVQRFVVCVLLGISV